MEEDQSDEAAQKSALDDVLLEQLYTSKHTGDLDELAERRVIRVLVVTSPMFYFLDGARERGATYDGMKEFEKYLNKKLGTRNLPVHLFLMPVRRDQLIPWLIEGRGDIAAANLTITPERSKLVDFTRPVYPDISELIVTGPSAPRLKSIDDLSGKEICVRASSSYYESLNRLNEKFSKSGKPKIAIKPVDENLEDEDILEMVNAGVIGISVLDSHKADFWIDIFDDIQIHKNLSVNSGGGIAWAIRKDSPQLCETANEFIRGHGKGTLFGNITLKRYLRDNRWIKNPSAAREREKFLKMMGIFEKYGSQYDIPYLLVAAQAYQESQLNQNLRSKAGAVGVMQIKPETAAGNPVNIRDIEKLDSNIHAGVKYLSSIMDRYFRNEPMTEMNRILFAFASYNAGPARIARLRDRATARGLDPNVWFKNVELVAARDIGRETVQYVSNIFKYYLRTADGE